MQDGAFHGHLLLYSNINGDTLQQQILTYWREYVPLLGSCMLAGSFSFAFRICYYSLIDREFYLL